MRTSRILTLGLTLCACGEPAGDPSPYSTTSQALRRPANLPDRIAAGGRERAHELPAELVDACPDTQWVGYLLEGPAVCPQVADNPRRPGRWVVAPIAPAGMPRTQGLKRYCLFTWQDAPPYDQPVPVEELPDAPFIRLERDCQVTAPASTEVDLPLAVASELTHAFDRQLGLARLGDHPGPLSPVRVAVIDTAADLQGQAPGDDLPDISDNGHADAVGTLIYRIGCFFDPVSSPCQALIRSELALGRRPVGPEFPNSIEWLADLGGDFGSQAETARAMYDAVVHWLDDDAEQHLIINLSLGWDAVYGGHRKGDMRLPARLAYDVARFATCQDALLIAAAGNRSDLTTVEGPMSPAAWERKPAACRVADAYDPMVHAVAGVDGADRILQSARRKGIPRLLAPAAHVVTPLVPDFVADPLPARVHTGSSMAAAAVSGIAALVWSVRPDLQRHEVMDIIYASGEPIGGRARFGLRGDRQPRVRVSACHAVELACAPGCQLAPERVPVCEPRRPRRGDARPRWAELVDVLEAFWSQGAGLPLQPEPPAAPPGPVSVPVSLEPWATPQPGIITCPTCGISSNRLVGKVYSPSGVSIWATGKILVDFAGCADKTLLAPPSVLTGQAFKISISVPPACKLKGAGMHLYTNQGKLYVSSSDMFVAP
jgi:hypothetical protein